MSDKTPNRIIERIASDIGAVASQVSSAVELLDGGATVPFISRYRKEATGGLTDTQLRQLDERLNYLRELDARRQSIIAAIDEQGKLDDRLLNKLNAVESKAELEDLYLPFRKKRRTKGQIAIEAGLEPLADSLWQNPQLDPSGEAKAFVAEERGVADSDAALDGARFILMERFAEDAELIARLRTLLFENSYLCSKVQAAKAADGAKFSDYFDHQERYARVPGHRAMAMFRGRADGVLSLSLLLPERQPDGSSGYGDAACLAAVATHLGFSHRDRPADDWRRQVLRSTWRVKLSMHLETELFAALRARADAEAIAVFSANLRDLLLAAPAGPRAVLGLDPGFRSGVKVVVVDSGGQVVDHCAIFPHQPQNQWAQSLQKLRDLCLRHSVELVAIGNGTASRETDKLAAELAAMQGLEGLTKIMVSEAGASVYSASLTAEQEFPDLDVTIRGAISIARRLQDPLAELVKIDPKAIGVGQYQHDVAQGDLGRSLDATVEDCVSAVGVDLQTASAALLARVAGLSTTLAENIVAWRNENGAFRTRRELKKVPRLGPKAFEQAAGFLRIRKGDDPLDASGVHPEAYPVVKRIIARTGRSLSELIGDTGVLRALDPASLVDEQFGLPTVKDILAELEKPGRDPRPEFRMVRFAEGVEKLSDLQPGQILEGQVTNVTAFGAFVDVGVHQDGLVHISALSDQFVKDPREVVKAGDIVKVKVMDVDAQRKRIGLTMRLSDEPGAKTREGGNEKPRGQSGKSRGSSSGRTEADQSQPSALALSLSAALTRKSGKR